jgi:RNA polymerase sigma-70 factor (ECF subfamily)
MSDFTDSALIARVVAGDDRNAFGELVRRYQSDVRGLLRRLTAGDIQRADDLAQETFIKAYQGLARFGGSAKFSTWLYRIAYNTFISSTRRSPALGTEEFAEETGAVVHEHDAEAIHARFDLSRAMGGLAPAERTALVLCCGHGFTHEEAAEVLKCPLGTVKTNINRGRIKLRERLLALEGSAR